MFCSAIVTVQKQLPPLPFCEFVAVDVTACYHLQQWYSFNRNANTNTKVIQQILPIYIERRPKQSGFGHCSNHPTPHLSLVRSAPKSCRHYITPTGAHASMLCAMDLTSCGQNPSDPYSESRIGHVKRFAFGSYGAREHACDTTRHFINYSCI